MYFEIRSVMKPFFAHSIIEEAILIRRFRIVKPGMLEHILQVYKNLITTMHYTGERLTLCAAHVSIKFMLKKVMFVTS